MRQPARIEKAKTVAEVLGGSPHLSPLLRKARLLGLESPEQLLRVAVKRGCTHYSPLDFDPADANDPSRDRLSDAELGIALISAAQTYDPLWLRCAAQLLSSLDLSPAVIARLAVMERCEPILRHFIQAAAVGDPENATFWGELDRRLSRSRRQTLPAGLLLPHRSRFMLQVGYSGSRYAGCATHVWLRPVRPRDGE